MPTYQVQLPNGQSYEVESPEPLDDQQVFAAAMQQQDSSAAGDDIINRALNYEEPTLLSNVGRGLGRGFVGALEMGALGAASLLEEEQELQARQGIQSLAESISPREGDPDSVAYQLSQGVGSLGAFAPLAVAGAFGAPAAATLGGGALLAAGMGAGEASERARESDVDEDVRNDAIRKGSLVGLTEILPAARIFKSLRVPFISQLVDQLGPQEVRGIGSRLRNAAATGTAEGLQEAAANELQNMIEMGYNPLQEFGEGTLQEGGVGAGAGAILQLIVDAFVPGRTPITAPQQAQNEEDVQTSWDQAASPVTETAAPIDQRERPPLPEDPGVVDRPPLPEEPGSESAPLPQEEQRPPDPEEQRPPVPEESTPPVPEESRPPVPDETVPLPEQPGESSNTAERLFNNMELPPSAPIRRRLSDNDLNDEQQRQEVIDGLQRLRNNKNTSQKAKTRIDEFLAIEANRNANDGVRSALFDDTGRDAETDRSDIRDTAETNGDGTGDSPAVRGDGDLGGSDATTDTPEQSEPVSVAPDNADVEDVVGGTEDVDSPLNQRFRDEQQRAIYEKRIEDMDPEEQGETIRELRREINTDERTGLGTNRAWLNRRRKPVVASVDLDNLKWVNDNLGHRAGDEMIAAVGDAMRQAGIAEEAYHVSGDEFYVQGDTEAELETGLTAAREALNATAVEGNNQRFTRPDMSWGIAETIEQAEVNLQDEKAAREAAGERAARGEAPADVEPVVATAGPESTDTGQETPDPGQIPDEPEIDDGNDGDLPVNEPETPITEEDLGRAEINTNPDDTTIPASDIEALRRGTETGSQRTSKGLRGYFAPEKYERVTDALNALAYDIATNAPAFQTKQGSGFTEAEREFFRDTGGANAKAARAWIRENLGAETTEFVNARIEAYSQYNVLGKSSPHMVTDPTTLSFLSQLEAGAAATRSQQADALKANILASLRLDSWFTPAQATEVATEIANKRAQATGDADQTRQLMELETEFRRAVNALSGSNKPAESRTNLERVIAAIEGTAVTVEPDADVADTISLDDVYDQDLEAQLEGYRLAPITNPALAALLSGRIHPATHMFLRRGDLAGAMRTAGAYTPNKTLSRLMSKLAEQLPEGLTVEMRADLTVEGVMGITPRANSPQAAGVFDPNTNKIFLHETFADDRAMLHEVVHALTEDALSASRSSPYVKQLQGIYNAAKPHLKNHNAGSNINEFVAEVMSEPEVQKYLDILYDQRKPESLWQQILQAVGRFLSRMIGRPVGAIQNSDSVISLVEQIIDTSFALPGDLQRTAGMARAAPMVPGYVGNAPLTPKNMMHSAINHVNDSVRMVTKKNASMPVASMSHKIMNTLNAALPQAVKRNMMIGLPMVGVADVSKWVGIPEGETIHDLIEEKNGKTQEAANQVEVSLQKIKAWQAKSTPEEVELFNSIIADSTVNEVDPTKPRNTYTQNNGVPTPDKVAAWDDLNARFKRLSAAGGDAEYVRLRDLYADLFEQLRSNMMTALDDSIQDPEQQRRVKTLLMDEIYKNANIDPYFPLMRSGDFWISYVETTGDGPQEIYYSAFESEVARERAIEALEANPQISDVEQYQTLRNLRFDNVPPSSFVGNVIQSLSDNQVDQAAIDEITKMFIQAMPETAIAKSMQQRSGVLGFEMDALQVAQTRAFSLARTTVNQQYSRRLYQQLENARERVAAGTALDDSETARYVIEELDRRVDFSVNPPSGFGTSVARGVNRLAFLYTLGFNVSSVVVNMTQLPFVVLPFLGGRTNWKDATGRLLRAGKVFATAPRDRQMVDANRSAGTDELTTFNTRVPSIDNYYVVGPEGELSLRTDMDEKLNQPLGDGTVRDYLESIQPIMQAAERRGLLTKSLLYDTLDADQIGREKTPMDWVTAGAAFMFHSGERMNRQVALSAAYLNELNRLESAEPSMTSEERQAAAVRTALHDVQLTNGGAILDTAPRIAQKHIGRIAMMYKTFGVQMYYTQFKLLRQALDSVEFTPEQRREAKEQLAGIQGMVFLGAGLQGLTIYGMMAALWDLFFTDEGEEDFDTLVRKAVGEEIFKGGVNQVTKVLGGEGVDVASRIGLSDMIFATQRYNYDPSLEKDLVTLLGGPAWSTIARLQRGMSDIGEGNFQRGVEAMLPAGISNPLKTIFRYADEGATTRRGDPIMGDIPAGLLAAQFFGFSPAEYTLNQERNQQLKNIERYAKEQNTLLRRKYYIAMRMGDIDEIRNVFEQIREYNQQYPQLTISPEDIRKSMESHRRTTSEMYNGVRIDPRMKSYLMGLAQEWDQGLF